MQHIPLLFVLVTMGGCATAQERLVELKTEARQCEGTSTNEEQRQTCWQPVNELVELEHEREDRRLIRRDKLIAYLNACDAHPGLVIFEERWGRSNLPNQRQQRKAKKLYRNRAYTP